MFRVYRILIILSLVFAPVSSAFAKTYCVKNPTALSGGAIGHFGGIAAIVVGGILLWANDKCFFPSFPIPNSVKSLCKAFGVDPTSHQSRDSDSKSGYYIGGVILVFGGFIMFVMGGRYFYPSCCTYTTDAFSQLRETIADSDLELQETEHQGKQQHTYVVLDPSIGSSSETVSD